jgi:hypothetical protein
MLEVQYHHHINGWLCSANSDCYDTIEELLPVVGNLRPFRARASEDLPWEHVPNRNYPHRYKDTNGEFWEQLDNIPYDAFPVLDVVHMTYIAEPPTPEPTMSASTTSPATATPAPPPPDCLVDIRVGRNKEDGKLTMQIDATHLHALLDSMGAKHDGRSYHDKPDCNFSVVSGGKMSPHLLLRREYPMKVALAGCFDRPPTVAQLTALCESGHTAVKTILDHYQPVDIRYSVVKVVK